MIGFVHIAKTAGTSVKFILRNSFGLGHCNLRTLRGDGTAVDEDLDFAKKVYFNLRSVSGHTLVDPTVNLSEPIRYFTFLRDPLKRTASHYQQYVRHGRRQGKDTDFETYIRAPRNQDRQVRKIAGTRDLEKAKQLIAERFFFVGLVERFEESVSVLARLCPYPLDVRYPRLKVTKVNTEKDQVLADPTTRAMLEEANQLDLALYEHVRDVVYPAQLEQARLDEPGVLAEEVPDMGLTFSYRLNRSFTQAIYRPLVKRQRKKRKRADRADGRGPAAGGAPAGGDEEREAAAG